MPESNNPGPSNPEDMEGIDFGKRQCEVCPDEVDAINFGAHVLSHDPVVLQTMWPGGIRGVLGSLRQSLLTSIEIAEGRPEVQERLRFSLNGIDELSRRLD